jgi:integrase
MRLQGGLIKPSSLKRWEKTVRVGILPYLQFKQVKSTNQINETTFDDYAAFRSSTVKTRITLRGELDIIGQFIRSYLVKHKLIAPELAISKDLIKRPKLREADLLANPAFTESDFQLFLKRIRQWIPEFDRQKPKSYYFRKLYYEWVLVAKNTGARPEELMKLRWRDIEHQDVRRHSETARQENILYLKEQGIDYSNLTEEEQESLGDVENWITLVTLQSAKTGNLRTVPCNLSKVFDRWRDFQKDWLSSHYPGLEITPNSLVWGNPEKLLQETFSDSHFSRTWREVRDPIKKDFKGHWISTQPYTRYSLRSTFIEVQLMKGISPVLVAEMAGHDIKVLYEIYQKLNVRQMAKEITNIDRGRKRGSENQTRSALDPI